MRILVSGLTGAHGGRFRLGSVQRMNPTEFVVRALREAGHEVTWEGYKLNSDLAGHDLLWFVMSSPKSMSAMNYGAGGLALLGRWRGPYVLALDDWNLRRVFNDSRSLLSRDGEDIEHAVGQKPFFRSETFEDLSRFHPCIERGLARMLSLTEPGTYVVLAYGWGDLDVLRDHLPAAIGSLTYVDPSPSVYHVIADQGPVPKQRRWTLAALAKHDRWLKEQRRVAEWPVFMLGPKARGGVAELDELGVYSSYRSSWGVLSPPYPHAGSGWWRTRFIYSAAARCVLLSENDEAARLGDAYALRLSDVESMNEVQLEALAQEQANALRPWMISWDEFVARCDSIARAQVEAEVRA